MPIVIDRTNATDNQWINEFDRTFVGDTQTDTTGQLYGLLSDVTFTDVTKKLMYGAQYAQFMDWVYIPNIDVFNSLAMSVEPDIIVVPELLRTYDSNYWRVLYYTVGIDYNPLRCSWHGKQFMNILLNLWDGLNSVDDTQYNVGMKYMYQQYFTLDTPVQCILQTKPSAKKVNSDRANYIRQVIDFIFFVIVDPNVVVCGAGPKI